MNRKMKAIGIVVLVLLLFATFAPSSVQAAPSSQACWGQASKVFAQMGVMGEHSSSFDSPRMGLRNLARYLYALGVLPDDTMRSLGVFVATELGMSIDACK
jgi:hypothetical protein